MTSPLSTDDWAVDPLASQAAFDAAWDLRTEWHNGNRVSAAEFARQRAPATAAEDLLHALAVAEWVARDEAGEALPHFIDVLREVVPVHTELVAELLGCPTTRSQSTAEFYWYLSEQPEDASGTCLGRLGRYRVLRERGRGAMGVVFEVDRVALHESVRRRALKVLEPRGTPEERHRARTRFMREARAATSINHENVARAHDAAEESGVLWIEMDYVYGPNLSELVEHHKRGPVPLRLALDLVRQVARGLAAAHALPNPIVHRDVKPANVLLERVPVDDDYPHGWRVRVCDFGLARVSNELHITQSRDAPGTCAYMSPEQFHAPEAVDTQSDVYSLGVVAYELFTGTHPFWLQQNDRPETIALRIQSGTVDNPREVHPAIPESIAEFVMNMLCSHHVQRPTASDVAEKLLGFRRAFDAGSVVRVHAPGKAPDLSRTGRGRTTQVAPPLGWAAATGPATKVSAGTIIGLKLDVMVWKESEPNARWITEDHTLLPLRAGDHFRLAIRTHRPMFFYVLQLLADGVVVPLYPWVAWGQRSDEQSRMELVVPIDQNWDMRLGSGPSGIEAFVVLAREHPLPVEREAELRTLFTGLPKDAKVQYRGVDRVPPTQPTRPGGIDRGQATLSPARTITDPVTWLGLVLGSDAVRALSSEQLGMCYPFAGTE